MHFEHIVINHGFHCIQLQKEHLSKEGLVGNFQTFQSHDVSYLHISNYHLHKSIYIYIHITPSHLHRLANANGWWHLRLQRAGIHVFLGFVVWVVVSWKKGFICCLGIPWLWSQGHLCCIDKFPDFIPASMFHCDHPCIYVSLRFPWLWSSLGIYMFHYGSRDSDHPWEYMLYNWWPPRFWASFNMYFRIANS